MKHKLGYSWLLFFTQTMLKTYILTINISSSNKFRFEVRKTNLTLNLIYAMYKPIVYTLPYEMHSPVVFTLLYKKHTFVYTNAYCFCLY